ncbi:hypothetical protein VTP01DRAFT_2330, partial [Rhizomucor pusillus]|uniref:uncharacterized protein n=1 Tax=Rhizomucor pusillus TaxID=4840 RepID=UPI00374396D1
MLQEQLDNAVDKLKQVSESYREADLRAEQQEKKNQTMQQEIEAMEAKHEDLTAKYKDARAEMDELVRQLEVA